ncbi:MAG: tyrosine--tRNA ligase [Candidatus Thalassarchaeaceae archaeon]|nr:tyrosine--tRNA ligase [Candidatus Thalassarchaeaceae archaeon]
MSEDPISVLGEESRSRLERMFSSCDEVVGAEHVISVLAGGPSHSGDEQLVAYIGLEPSGTAHLGWVILADTIRNMLNEDVNVIILLADWHAWVNDKFNRDMDKISLAGEYMTEVFRVLLDSPEEGDGPGQLRFLSASEIMDSGKYWERVLRCSKNMSLSRVRRTFSIMGRDEDSSDNDLAAFYYPALQSADIFELEVDIAWGGMDQRKAHMYMREVADRNGWTKATCIHTPLLSGLGGSGGRMDSFDHKMSKSKPSNAILLHDDANALRRKMKKAFLEVGNPDSPVFEIAKFVVLPRIGEIRVNPKPEYGLPSVWNDLDSFVKAVGNGEIHPFDAKMAITDGLIEVLTTLSDRFESNSNLQSALDEITGPQ